MDNFKHLFLTKELLIYVGATASGGGHRWRLGKEGSYEDYRDYVGEHRGKTQLYLIVGHVLADDLGIFVLFPQYPGQSFEVGFEVDKIGSIIPLEIDPISSHSFGDVNFDSELVKIVRVPLKFNFKIVYSILFFLLLLGKIVQQWQTDQ